MHEPAPSSSRTAVIGVLLGVAALVAIVILVGIVGLTLFVRGGGPGGSEAGQGPPSLFVNDSGQWAADFALSATEDSDEANLTGSIGNDDTNAVNITRVSSPECESMRFVGAANGIPTVAPGTALTVDIACSISNDSTLGRMPTTVDLRFEFDRGDDLNAAFDLG